MGRGCFLVVSLFLVFICLVILSFSVFFNGVFVEVRRDFDRYKNLNWSLVLGW